MKIRNLLIGLSTSALVVSPMLMLTSCQKEIVYAAIEIISEKDTISTTQKLQMDIDVSSTTKTEKPEVTWSIDDQTLAYIDPNNGLLTAYSKVGKVTVTATLKANPKIKATKIINIVDFIITPSISCSSGMSASGDKFVLGNSLTIKYSFDKGNIDIDTTNIKVNGEILDEQKFEINEDNQTLTIKSYVFSSIIPASSTVSIDLSTKVSNKIKPSIEQAQGLDLDKCSFNNVKGGQQLVINYNLQQDYGIATKNDVRAIIKYSDGGSRTEKANSLDKSKKTISISIPDVNDEIYVTSVTVTIKTCELWENEDAISYIYNRTFSFSAGESFFGTAWLINPYDGKDLSSYQYYIATNWHVKYQLIACGQDFKIGNGKDATVSNYQTIRVIDWCDDKNMTYDGDIQEAVDLAVAHVDLSNAAQNDPAIKTQLDNLNTYYEQHGYITQIANTTSETKHYESMPLYTAGFPLQAQNNPKWEEHSFGDNVFEYRDGESTTQHSWEIGKSQWAFDVSPIYTSKNTFEETEMSNGSSGSMIIGNFGSDEHPYYKVVAIYWGAWSTDEESKKHEKHISFSIFNNERKNFLKDYIQ